MSKDFFSLIGDQLCAIKNSPFSKISSHANSSQMLKNDSHIRKSKNLSYNPDRLFNHDKLEEQKDDPDFIQFKKQQKEMLEKIQITLLKERTHQQLKKLDDKNNLLKTQDFIHPYSIFKVQRQLCTTCNICFQYNGNFNMGQTLKQGSYQRIQFMSCITCNCPMNSHIGLLNKNPFTSQIFSHLSSTTIQSQHLKVTYYPICFLKQPSKSLTCLINNFYNYLPQLGFKILSSKRLSRKEYQIFLIKQQIKTGLEKQMVQALLRFVQSLEKQEHWTWDASYPEDLDNTQYQIIKKIKNNLNIQQYLKRDDQIIVLFVRNINYFNHFQLINILKNYQKTLQSKFFWTPQQAKQKFLASCILFPQFFKLNHQIFVLPSQDTELQAQKCQSKLKDLLDLNNYTTIGRIKQIQREKLQQILKFQNSNKINYILGKQQLSPIIKRARIYLSAKIGPSTFTIPFRNAVDFIQISSAEKKYPFMMAFPEYLRSQRCVAILRPCFSYQNFDQILISLLRVNQFVLLKRKSLLFNQQQAKYLATIQKIEENSMQSYIKMMTSGVSQIVLTSKRGAIYQANILVNGSTQGKSQVKIKMLKNLPTLSLKRGTQLYEYCPTIKSIQSTQSTDVFKSFVEMFKLQSLLFPQLQMEQNKYVTNTKNGQLIKIEPDNKRVKQLKISSKMRQNVLSEIKKQVFNYWAFTSKSQFLTQQIASMFIPQTTLFDSSVIIVKPGYIHLVQKIKQALSQHRYHIIMQKTVLLSKTTATQLITNLSRSILSKSTLKNTIQVYCNQKLHILCVSKPLAKQQMYSLLSQFTFLPSKAIITDDYIDDKILKQVLLPVWNNQQSVLRMMASPLYNIEQAINSLYSPGLSNQDKEDILRYLVGSYFGVSIKDGGLNSQLGKFAYYRTTPALANLQSWFYSQLSHQNARYVPTLFQHRLIGQTCFVIQSDSGFPFLNLISTQFQEEKQKFQEVQNNERKSLILFLWAKKMTQFVFKMSSNSPNLKGWGRIVKKGTQWQGQSTSKQIQQSQKDFLQQCSVKFQDSEWQIQANIKRLIQSRFLNEKYNKQQKRKLIPYFPQGKLDQCIRIIQTQQTSKYHLLDKYSMIDPQHQKNNQKNLYTLNLFNVQPSIGTKEQFVIDLMIFLTRWEKESAQYGPMFAKLLQYFVENVLEHVQADVIASQFYIRLLKQYIYTSQSWLKPLLRNYPNFRKQHLNISNDEISGKKRKFLQKKQYYKDQHSSLTSQQSQARQKQYKNFNLNYQMQEQQMDKNNPLLNMSDPLHKKFALQQRNITLLRQGTQVASRQGVYVEFEKKITQNQELLMNKIKGQVNKFNMGGEQKILYETGLEKDIWYRKVKGDKHDKIPNRQSKLQDAIKNQIGKLMLFKQQAHQQANK